MGTIPAFHAQAAQDAADRIEKAASERDRASNFLDELDSLLADASREDAALTPAE